MNNAASVPFTSSVLLSLSLALGAATLACDPASADAERSRSDPNGVPIDAEDGCTLTQGYWKNHHTQAKNPFQQKQWPVDEDTAMCGKTWLETLKTPPKGDAWFILAHQWIAASLNVAAGAVPPPDVAAALAAAETMLADCVIDDAEHDAALAASELLDAFNNGAVGPGHCDDDGDDTKGDDTKGDDTKGDDTGDGTTGDDTTGGITDTFDSTDPIPG